nr:MAG: DNA N-6-adenine-methyltransferase [Bacteriophage sp.]
MTTTTNNFTNAGGAAYMSDRMDWETPTDLFAELDKEFHFTLDAASSETNHKCPEYYTAENSAFDHEWGGHTVFCNPPYGRAIADWVRKCSMEASRKNTIVVMLIPARTDTKWFHDYILNRAEIRFLKGRLRFETDGVPGGTAPFPSMVVVMRTGER